MKVRTPGDQESPQVFSNKVVGEARCGEASNLMRRPACNENRFATTSACVGWDVAV
jgi:hypothetical protein